MNNTAKLAALQELYAQLPTIECQGKCHDFCGPIAMTRLEAKRLPELRFFLMGRIGHATIAGDDMKCTALKSSRCSVYERRPAICRIWGLTEKLRCPFGCEPSVRWTEEQASRWLQAVHKIGL